jgi:hypothetical protein
VIWRVIGRVTPTKPTIPAAPPFEGGAALLELCGERRPCAAERLHDENGRTRDLLWRAGKLIEPATGLELRGYWPSIDGALRMCLRLALFHPPAADPAGQRLLVEDNDQHRWELHLTGRNSCALSGVIRLDAEDDQIDLRELTVDGKPWSKGGRLLAEAKVGGSAVRPASALDEAGDARP